MRAAPLIAAALLVATVSASFAADAAVGSVTELSGTVEIDAFGKGAFIAAVKGDRVYDITVMRTGPQSSATVELQGTLARIPPDTTYRLADALEGQRRTKRLGWLPALLGVLKNAVASFNVSGSDVVLGDRQAEVRGDDAEWIVEEDDPEQLLLEARDAVRKELWMLALSSIEKIPTSAAGSLPPGELAFLRGSACFGLGDYASAAVHLSAAEPLIRGSADPDAAGILPVLLFQLGASRFLVGEDGPAVAPLASFVALDLDSPFTPYAYQLLLRALAARGETAKAQEILAQAKARFAGTPHEGEFKTLPPAP